ncbi:hypothetical protein BDN72DRAFT_139826 [Pluteus cervinus]|uniref:Uncharacterized protein n=1 Tax=Pluteus cervinus TaxID=181527 RepID=A0ACD3AMD8_9AGAR|nr:hypothetical protein BDN72DRAFT_139826 [Pluteus cervinus]
MLINSLASPYAPQEPGTCGLFFGVEKERVAINNETEIVDEGELDGGGVVRPRGRGKRRATRQTGKRGRRGKLMTPGNRLMKVLVRIKVNEWKYMGQYKLERQRPLSVVEWRTLPRDTQTFWINRTLEMLVRTQKNMKVTLREIDCGFATGDYALMVWGMVCQGYDLAFQQDLAEKLCRDSTDATVP